MLSASSWLAQLEDRDDGLVHFVWSSEQPVQIERHEAIAALEVDIDDALEDARDVARRLQLAAVDPVLRDFSHDESPAHGRSSFINASASRFATIIASMARPCASFARRMPVMVSASPSIA